MQTGCSSKQKGQAMIRPVFLALIIFGLAACASSPRFAKYTDVTYPPTTEVEVLRTKPADRPYIELGELRLRIKKSNEDDAILFLKAKAMEIGADAIVILGEQSRGAVVIPTGTIAMAAPIRYLVAVAIRYKR